MKKSILSSFAILGLFFATQSIQAQEEPMEPETEEVEPQSAPEIGEFQSIDVLALPQSIKDATMTEFNAVASEAWVKMQDEEKIYKLKVAVDGESKTIYANTEGEWLKEDEVID
ncbi:hypothetical protein [Zunongwangia endophytica]|uniref:Beta-lactamase-inhibitor-like PepSY-like domain-containing protein n=1 Tax=Zunongwangia endophytica TaxID=1808945 RepID=A0ABV8H6Q5_9FLAO|nr:hypothetical protein [Zunongwangia endophytica]MDN3595605.1 hypothetical protein [Zunongwangia endophytica]